MSTVYTALLFQLDAPAGSSAVFGPVPAGHRYVATDIVAWGNLDQYQTLIDDVELFFSDSGHNFRVWWLGPGTPANLESRRWQGRQVLNTGQFATFQNDDSHDWQIRVTGFDLLLP